MKKLETKDIEKNGVAVENYEGVLSYICEDVNRSIRLTTFLKDELSSIFGTHNTKYKGDEYNFHVWIIEFEQEIFQIFTANGKGTCFSIVDPTFSFDDDGQPDGKSDVCLRFLKDMDMKLQKLIK